MCQSFNINYYLIKAKIQISKAAVVLYLCKRQVIRLKMGILKQGDASIPFSLIMSYVRKNSNGQ
jgi:hypothetical protein